MRFGWLRVPEIRTKALGSPTTGGYGHVVEAGKAGGSEPICSAVCFSALRNKLGLVNKPWPRAASPWVLVSVGPVPRFQNHAELTVALPGADS